MYRLGRNNHLLDTNQQLFYLSILIPTKYDMQIMSWHNYYYLTTAPTYLLRQFRNNIIMKLIIEQISLFSTQVQNL